MGVFTLQLLVYSQLILLSLQLNKITNAQQISQSSLNNTTATPLNATENHTENNVSNSSSNSTYSDNTTAANNLTTQMPPIVSKNSTSGPTQSNSTITASAGHTNATQAVTSSTTNINSTAVTSTNSTENATTTTKPETKQTTTYIDQNTTISLNEHPGLSHSEQFLTIFFSVMLGLIVLVSLVHMVYKFSRSKERSIQYTHRRLQNEETGEPFGVQDDTLVISGGLYDGPQIYNPTMTVQNEEEIQTDLYGYASRPAQFRLEFLREDQDQALEHETSTFKTFQAHDQEP